MTHETFTPQQAKELKPLAEKYFLAYDKEVAYADERGDESRGLKSSTTRASNKLHKALDVYGIRGTVTVWKALTELIGR